MKITYSAESATEVALARLIRSVGEEEGFTSHRIGSETRTVFFTPRSKLLDWYYHFLDEFAEIFE